MLAVHLVCCAVLSPALFEARARSSSAARREFESSLSSGADELALSVLLAAEERHTERPSDIADVNGSRFQRRF